jgi:hypothetical protein
MNQRTHFIGEGDRPIVLFFMAPGRLTKKLPLVEKASHTLFRSDTQQNMMSRYQLPRYQPAEWPSMMILRLV